VPFLKLDSMFFFLDAASFVTPESSMGSQFKPKVRIMRICKAVFVIERLFVPVLLILYQILLFYGALGLRRCRDR
jgi:hypothetical protein